MAKPNTLEQLRAEKEQVETQLAQEQHKLERLENRKKYLEKGERQKRTHRLCNLGGTIESLAPEVKDLTRTEMTELIMDMIEKFLQNNNLHDTDDIDALIEFASLVRELITMMQSTQNELRNHADELVDIREISVDKDLPKEERIAAFIRQIKNPYRFRCGEFVVNACFAGNGVTLEECLQGILR